MKIYDLSIPISNATPVYPGDPPVTITPMAQIANGDMVNVSLLSLGNHTGTHVDPPLHFIAGGKTVDQLDLNVLCGPACVVDFTHIERVITANDFAGTNLPADAMRILCKTRNSTLWEREGFQKEFVAFDGGAAQWLIEHGVKLIGIDYLSAELFDAPEPRAHLSLLGAGVIIVEGLNLRDITPGDYTLACLPLKIKDGDGAPARAVLFQT